MAKLKHKSLSPAQVAAKETTRKNGITLSMIILPGEVFVGGTFVRKCRSLGINETEALEKLKGFEAAGFVVRRVVGTIDGWAAV